MDSRTPAPPGGVAPRGPCWSRCFTGRVRSAGICATGSGMEFPVLLVVMNGIADLPQHVNAVHAIEHLHHLAMAFAPPLAQGQSNPHVPHGCERNRGHISMIILK